MSQYHGHSYHGHIVVVDDDPVNRLKLARVLKQQEHTVSTAENGREVLEMLEEQSFDLILLDIVMPEMDGHQVLEYLKKHNMLRNMPVIVISAVDDMESMAKCIKIGAEDYLFKPFDPVLLDARVGASLEKKWLRDQEIEYHRELADTNEKLAAANRNYMEMLGFVTHELKSPLAAMQSMIAVVVGGFLGEVPEKVNGRLIRIKRNCEELQDMVKNYLDLSRAERGELVANKSEITFHQEVVVPCVDQTHALFDSHNMTLTVNSPENLTAMADPELMRISLTNYLSNAAKYGVENGQASLNVEVLNGILTVRVWNEGTGFTAEDKEKLFGKFSRLKNQNTADKRGSGLGLFLLKSILDQHGGKVWADSEPGEWAEFCFSFPIASDIQPQES